VTFLWLFVIEKEDKKSELYKKGIVVFFIITLLAQLYVSVDVLLTGGQLLYDSTISLNVTVPRQELSRHVFVC
jgi:hypothetical protein